MWYKKYTFFYKQEGLATLPPADYYTRPLTPDEHTLYPDIVKLHPEIEADPGLLAPPPGLALPAELQELLQYANGGTIINGEREFGYFSQQEIRYYYFAYGFFKWAPCLLPVALNGGGKFYACDFRNIDDIRIVAVSSGDISYESQVLLGHSLDEVLQHNTNIEEELDRLYPAPAIMASPLQELKKQLQQLQQDKAQGLLDLKAYLQAKRLLQQQIRALE